MTIRHESTDIKKTDFVQELTKTYSVYHACQRAGIGRRTAYTWRKQDEEFSRQWDEALEDSIDALEKSLYERALVKDTLAAIFLLKGAKPEKYRERHEVNNGQLTDEQLESKISELVRKTGIGILAGREAKTNGNGHSKPATDAG